MENTNLHPSQIPQYHDELVSKKEASDSTSEVLASAEALRKRIAAFLLR